MKLLIVNGTPKVNGICYSFVEASEAVSKELGIDFDTINLTKENISKCKMCDQGWGICFNQHVCIFGKKDGFNALQEKVKVADAFVFITPVYWSEVSEELKIFLDKLRRCQATKKWDAREDEVSYIKGKASILVAHAGGGGGGILDTFAQMERALLHMEGDEFPREKNGVFDYIAVNRWNQDYKRIALQEAIRNLVAITTGAKEAPSMNRGPNGA
jgi:multimeric flavodoxin WrbA